MVVMNLVILVVFAGFLVGFIAGLLILMLEANDDPIMYTGGAAYC